MTRGDQRERDRLRAQKRNDEIQNNGKKGKGASDFTQKKEK